MKGMIIKNNVAVMVDDQGKTHITRMDRGLWTFQGKTFGSPFEAFKEVEDANTRRVSA